MTIIRKVASTLLQAAGAAVALSWLLLAANVPLQSETISEIATVLCLSGMIVGGYAFLSIVVLGVVENRRV